MRENLFRGQLIHSKEWVVGNLILSQNGNYYVVPSDVFEEDGHHLRIDSDLAYRVNKHTVGQYTGLIDKNGTKIFEGDRLMNEDCGEGFEDALYYEVAYNEKLARFELIEVGYPIALAEHGYDYARNLEQLDEFIDIEEATACVIIGNIYEIALI